MTLQLTPRSKRARARSDAARAEYAEAIRLNDQNADAKKALAALR